jgi:hypothetical protein
MSRCSKGAASALSLTNPDFRNDVRPRRLQKLATRKKNQFENPSEGLNGMLRRKMGLCMDLADTKAPFALGRHKVERVLEDFSALNRGTKRPHL